jgi:hypothetical protein
MSLLQKLAVTLLIVLPFQETLAAPILHEKEVTISVDKSASQEGIYRTVKAKARVACRTHAVFEYTRIRMERQCFNEFMDAAIAEIANPKLNAYHLEQTGRSPAGLDDESSG